MQLDTLDHAGQITIGTGSFAKVPGLIGDRRYCVVTYGEPYFADLARKLAASAGAAVLLIDDVAPNPDFTLLAEQASRFSGLKSQPEVFVALGGGSVIDTAKILASAGGDFARVKTYLQTGGGENALASTPIIAVPTTAGTGSEVTCWATVWDSGAKKKYSLNRLSLYPEHAVIDPELMLGKSRGLTISTGLDALSHALESIWNVNATDYSTDLAVEAASEILQVLPKLTNNLGSLELRGRMARASLIAGLAFSKTKTAIAHSISYPITLNHNVIHGIACSFSLPIILHSMLGEQGLCGDSLRRIFGDDFAEGPRQLIDFLESLGVSPRPVDHGVNADEWVRIVDDAFAGERGRNFIGSKEKLLQAAQFLGVVTVADGRARQSKSM